MIDAGELIDPERLGAAERLSHLLPHQWTQSDRDFASRNPTVHGRGFPRKLVFGSDYFYGQSNGLAPIESVSGRDNYPPFSYAKGGFSVGWGAAVLRPDDCDLVDWPISNQELDPYYASVLGGIPYSGSNDLLAANFPFMREPGNSLRLTQGNAALLHELEASGMFDRERLVFGKARLLANADSGCVDGCKYCGCCMSGCAYGAIYKASRDIDGMIAAGEIDYRAGLTVHRLEESGTGVTVLACNAQGAGESWEFDRVFLAAGALNSTRIVLQSKQLYDEKVEIKTTIGFVAPMFRLGRMPLDWPDCNTMPGIFLEYKVEGLSDHWVHTQLSTPNEMALEKLGVTLGGAGWGYALRRRAAEHLVVALCNLHSDHANNYEIVLKKGRDGENDKIISARRDTEGATYAIDMAIRKLFRIGRKVGCYPILPAVQRSTQVVGYHIGGGLPMRRNPQTETETNCFGSPKGWKRIHVVDSSVFPSVPGTTIGLLAMANAARIATEVEL